MSKFSNTNYLNLLALNLSRKRQSRPKAAPDSQAVYSSHSHSCDYLYTCNQLDQDRPSAYLPMDDHDVLDWSATAKVSMFGCLRANETFSGTLQKMEPFN